MVCSSQVRLLAAQNGPNVRTCTEEPGLRSLAVTPSYPILPRWPVQSLGWGTVTTARQLAPPLPHALLAGMKWWCWKDSARLALLRTNGDSAPRMLWTDAAHMAAGWGFLMQRTWERVSPHVWERVSPSFFMGHPLFSPSFTQKSLEEPHCGRLALRMAEHFFLTSSSPFPHKNCKLKSTLFYLILFPVLCVRLPTC